MASPTLLATPNPNKKNYLNLGCGKVPIESTDEVNVFNVDASIKDSRIINFDITKYPYPYDSKYFDRIYLFHTIEHIAENKQPLLLAELRRVLKDKGELVLAYPEFSKIAQNWIDNKDGKRDFWKACIYGRARDSWDRHRTLMDTGEFSKRALQLGFNIVAAVPEASQEFNTVAILVKCEPILTYEEILGNEFHLKS